MTDEYVKWVEDIQAVTAYGICVLLKRWLLF
jgi:hypothetical protein